MQNKDYYIEKGNKEREISNFQKALLFYNKAKEIGNSCDSEMGIAHCLRVIGDFESALKIYDRISKKYKRKEIVADALLGKALSLKGLSKTKKALFNLKKAEKIYEDLNDEIGLANLYWAYGVVLRVSGDFADAIEYCERAASMFNYYGDEKGVLYSNCALGGLERVLGNLKFSFKHYKNANEISKKINDKFGTAYSYCGLGNYYRMKNEFGRAMSYFKKAEKIYCEIKDIVSYSYTLWSMGILNTIEGNFKEAKNYFEVAKDNFEKTKDKRGIVYCLIGTIQLKSLIKDDYNFEIKDCENIFKNYNLKWEKLLFEILFSRIKDEKKDFKKKISSFGSIYEFNEFPLNFP